VPFFLPAKVDFFPHPLSADSDGLLAIGSQLSVEQILLAYQFGIFPWNHADDPLLWWYTHPRCVLFPEDLKISKSMRPYLNGDRFHHTMDTAFHEVITRCQAIKRKEQDETWITKELISVFNTLHNMGLAHSVEVWEGKNLVGGLYGLALGKIFFGESMFAERNNASKYGFIQLVAHLKNKNFKVIDCQQETAHLKSLGAQLISKESFFKYLKRNTFEAAQSEDWRQK
jgi:leucyl/phenylalanyl-tRNA--protein transferase